jgi:hypothetical protein
MSDTKDEITYGYDRGGRPTKYQEDYPDAVRKLARAGSRCTDENLARYFAVAKSTINLWKLQQPRFSEAVREVRAGRRG